MAKWAAETINLGPTVCSRRTRGHTFLTDVPDDLEGKDLGALPPEKTLPALANCMSTVVALACEAGGLSCEGMRVEVRAEVIEGENRLDNFRLTIHMPEPLDGGGRRTVTATGGIQGFADTLKQDVGVEAVETFGGA